MEVHGRSDLVGELLRPHAGLLVAHVDALEAHSGNYLAFVLEPPVEVLAVLEGIALLRRALLVQDAPAEDAPDARLLGGPGDDVLGVVEVHERRGSAAHHLHASELGSQSEVLVGPVGIDLEHLVEEIGERQIVDDALHHGHRHMGVGVDHSGHHYVAGGVDLPVCRAVICGADRDDPLAVDNHITLENASGLVLCDDPCVADRCNHEDAIDGINNKTRERAPERSEESV